MVEVVKRKVPKKMIKLKMNQSMIEVMMVKTRTTMMFEEEMEEESEDGDGLVEYIEDFNNEEKLEEDM